MPKVKKAKAKKGSKAKKVVVAKKQHSKPIIGGSHGI